MLELANEIRRLACAAGTTESRLALEELALRYVAEAAGLDTRAADGMSVAHEYERLVVACMAEGAAGED
jgi:hypothetical protein